MISTCQWRRPPRGEDAFVDKESPLTAVAVESLFSPIYSLPGSNRRPKEERCISHWCDLLEELLLLPAIKTCVINYLLMLLEACGD